MRGGMGTISESIRKSAENHGAYVVTNADVDEVLLSASTSSVSGALDASSGSTSSGPSTGAGASKIRAAGVRLLDGTELRSKVVISGCTPYQTFLELMPWEKETLVGEFGDQMQVLPI